MSLAKPTRQEIFAMSVRNERLTLAIESLFERVLKHCPRQQGRVALDASGNATITFAPPIDEGQPKRLMLTAEGDGVNAVTVNFIAWTSTGGLTTSATIKGFSAGSTSGVNVDWTLL